MPKQRKLPTVDSFVDVLDEQQIEYLGDAAFLGQYFLYLKAEWAERSGLSRLLGRLGEKHTLDRPRILSRSEEISLPGVKIRSIELPAAQLFSLTSDKQLYQVDRDRVRLLIAAPQEPDSEQVLHLKLNGATYGSYTLRLDSAGLFLWEASNLPEGRYEAVVEGSDLAICDFLVATYQLAPLHAELVSQQLSDTTFSFDLEVTAFQQPYIGPLKVELMERGQRVGNQFGLVCDAQGHCHGQVILDGPGPFSLNLLADERSATVALKGSEQARRSSVEIGALGEEHSLNLLPTQDSVECRSLYIAPGAQNNAPFLLRNPIGREVELEVREAVQLLQIVLVDPVRQKIEEISHTDLQKGQVLRFPVPNPYGLLLLGAFIGDRAWEGWSAVLHPTDLDLRCIAPAEAKPGSTVSVKLSTGVSDRSIPVQFIVKDQRLVSASDPQVELAACIQENLKSWEDLSFQGNVDRELRSANPPSRAYMRSRVMRFSSAIAAGEPDDMVRYAPMMAASAPMGAAPVDSWEGDITVGAVASPAATLTRVRMQFPEVVYNAIVQVQGETEIQVALGEGLTRYTIEAFALDPQNFDWQRAETSLEASQPIYGELSVSPFAFTGDGVTGHLYVGSSSGKVLAEVQLDGSPLPLFTEQGQPLSSTDVIPAGSTVLFQVSPGMITAIVRDPVSGEADVSEQFVSEPGRLKHRVTQLRFLQPGELLTLDHSDLLEIHPLPGLERSFQLFVEGAAHYPHGCIEQTACKLVGMFAGYITNLEKPEVASDYAVAISTWYKRLMSMALPNGGFCMYPPQEGGSRNVDMHYAPKGMLYLLKLPASKNSGIVDPEIRTILDDIKERARAGANFYKLALPPKNFTTSEDAFLVLSLHGLTESARSQALTFARTQLQEHEGKVYAKPSKDTALYFGSSVATRIETAYAAAALLLGREQGDLPRALAATNYVASQMNEENRFYSSSDTAAGLSLMLALRELGVGAGGAGVRVEVNGQPLALDEALRISGPIESLRGLEGIVTVQTVREIVEDWNEFHSDLPVEVFLAEPGKYRPVVLIKPGDAIDLVVRIPRYEPGMLVYVCLPAALARVVGGGQVKRFSLDFSERKELRVPLAAVSTTVAPGQSKGSKAGQHWAIVVRNMYKEEQVGNPGPLKCLVL